MIKLYKNKDKLYLINSYLIILLGFFLPISKAGVSIVVGLIFINWIVIADYRITFNEIKNNKVLIAGLLFVLIHILSLIFSNDLELSFSVLKKEYKWLVLPILMIFVRKEHIKYYIGSFLFSITLSELFSYLIWFELIEPFKYATVSNPTVFMSHITYNPILAFSIYLILYFVLFDKTISKNKKILYTFFIITMTINMFITGGRAGQIMFFSMLIILSYQYYKSNLRKFFLMISIVIPLIFVTSYTSSDLFKKRVDSAISNIKNFNENQNTSLGLRFTYAINSTEIIKENPIFGVGIGNFKIEYPKIHEKNTPHLPIIANQPHNMYILVLVEYGIIGLISLLYIFYIQIKFALNSKNPFTSNVGLVLPLLFLIIMFSEIYLFLHTTTWLFIYFSAILYKIHKS